MEGKQKKCPVCKKTLGEDAVAHILVGHGPLVPDAKKRIKTRKMLSRLHRRLEERGFSEIDAHLIVRMVAEELRKLGLT